MRIKTKFDIPKDFEEQFKKSILTFHFQTIYCPLREQLCHFNELDTPEFKNLLTDENNNEIDLGFLGPYIILPILNLFIDLNNSSITLFSIYDKEIAKKVVFAEIDPMSYEDFEEKDIYFEKGLENDVEGDESENHININANDLDHLTNIEHKSKKNQKIEEIKQRKSNIYEALSLKNIEKNNEKIIQNYLNPNSKNKSNVNKNMNDNNNNSNNSNSSSHKTPIFNNLDTNNIKFTNQIGKNFTIKIFYLLLLISEFKVVKASEPVENPTEKGSIKSYVKKSNKDINGSMTNVTDPYFQSKQMNHMKHIKYIK